MLNKKNSSSNNLKSAIFAGALAASTAAVSDQVNTVVTPTQNGVTATASGNGTIVSGNIGKSSTFGSTANIGVATKLGESGAIAINIEKGADMQRFLGSLGFSFKNGNLIFSGEQLSAKGKYMFTSGELEESMKQNKAGVALKLKLSEGFFNSFVMDGSITKAQSKELASKEVVVDSATTFAIYDNLRRIAGGEQKQASAGFIFRLGENTRLELKGKYETLDFDTRYLNITTQKQTGGEGKFTHVFNNGVKFDIGGGTSLAGNTAATGVQIPVGSGTLGFEARRTEGINGNKANNYVGLTYNLPLGGGEKTPKFSFNNKGAEYSNIVADVVARNNAFASQTLLTKVDEKMLKKLEIQNAGLPVGVDRINNAGDLEISSLNVLSIAGITKDAAAYTNAGEFTIVNGKLRIISKNIAQPASGTNTYVVTTNNVGGGTATITIVVAKGSVIIQSVTVVESLANNPGTIGAPTIESKTSTTINTAPGAVTGMTNVRVELYSDAGLTTLVGTAANGDFTGLSASTTYFAVTVGDDVNETTGATETKRSTALSVVTDAPTNVPGTIGVPTIESKTSTTINTAPGAVTGMTNVRVELYSDAGLTTLVGTAANGDFTGLSASTTYFAVTVGDDVNENTGVTETKRSTALTVVTDAPPNLAPVALDGSVDALGNGSVILDFSSLVSDDTNADNQLTFQVMNNPNNLIITGTFPNITIATTPLFSGDTFFTYRVQDTNGVLSEVKRIDVIGISF